MADFSAKSPGDKNPAKDAAWITAVSAAAYAFQSRGELGSSKGSKPSHSIDRSAIKVKNLTGSDLVRGNYVQLGDFELDARDPRKMWFEGNLYDEESESRIAIVTNAVKDDSRVDAVLLGIAVAVVDVTDTGHRFAEPADGEFVLVSAESGPVEILDTVSETGEQECAVLLAASGGGGIRAGWAKIVGGDVPAMIETENDETVTVLRVGVGTAVPMRPVSPTTPYAEQDRDWVFIIDEEDPDYEEFEFDNMCGDDLEDGKYIQWKTMPGGRRFVDSIACFDPQYVEPEE